MFIAKLLHKALPPIVREATKPVTTSPTTNGLNDVALTIEVVIATPAEPEMIPQYQLL